MAANLGAIRTKLLARLQDDAAKLTNPGELDAAIASALERYSKDRPRQVVAQVDGDGGFSYATSGLTGWVDGFSGILDLIYPYLSTDQQPKALDRDRYLVRRLPAGTVLHFIEHTPAAAEDFLVEYTVPHTLDADSSTVPASDDEALADLSAAEAFDYLAAVSLQELQSNIDADTVDRLSKAGEYRQQAAAFRKKYEAKIGSTADQPVPAAAYAEADLAFGDSRASDRFFHARDRF
jgi:hypothetical protein